jgi:hypothetical protein
MRIWPWQSHGLLTEARMIRAFFALQVCCCPEDGFSEHIQASPLRQSKPPKSLPVRFDMGNVAGTLVGQLGSDNRDHESHH